METSQEPQKNCIPPSRPKRNEAGLYTHLDYHFKPNGKVDWRKMIPSEYVVPNNERTQETDITQIADKDLLILLEGFQEVADIRGYSEAKTITVAGATDNFVAADTYITWIPNYETEGRTIVRSGSADAHTNNTKSFGVNFLTTIAENRSFVRAVRRFLKIPILGKDEMGDAAPNGDSPTLSEGHAYLNNLLHDNNIKFESFKNKMIKLGAEGAEEWQAVTDVPEDRVYDIAEQVKAALAEKKAKAQAKASG